MDSAVVGLVGVVIGGAIGVVTAFLRERRQDKREERAWQREERQALRMVHQELVTIQMELEAAAENKVWWTRAALKFEMPAWERFGHTVAASAIDENSWVWVAHAYDEIARLNETVERSRIRAAHSGRSSLTFDENALALTEQTTTSVAQGAEFLSAYMNGEPSPATISAD